jgi:uncharacterized membrane protein
VFRPANREGLLAAGRRSAAARPTRNLRRVSENVFRPPSLPADAAPARVGSRRDVAPTPDTLFGLSFDSVNRAQQFMLAIRDLADGHKLHLVDAVLVVKDDDGHVRVRETIDPQPGRSALSGAIWTGLLGLIVGGPVGWIAGLGIGAGVGAAAAKVIDLGIPDEWVAWFKDAVRPDTATVLVLASDIDQLALGTEVDRFPNVRLVHTTIHADAFSELRSAFNDRAPTGKPNG